MPKFIAYNDRTSTFVYLPTAADLPAAEEQAKRLWPEDPHTVVKVDLRYPAKCAKCNGSGRWLKGRGLCHACNGAGLLYRLGSA